MSESFLLEDTSSAKLQVSAKGLKRFRDNPYWLSMHWGLYAINGRGEWVMHHERIPFDVYKKRMPLFNPTRFDAEEWADLMVEGGLKALLITSKHHDGFCLWDSKLTSFKVTNTPFKRDIIGELAPALRDRGLGLVYYYSLLDWTHPGYKKDWPAYVAYYQGQLKELLTNYGDIWGVVFDGYWPRVNFDKNMEDCAPMDSVARGHSYDPAYPWDLAGTYDLIHTLQPDAMVVNNTHVPPLKGEDAQVWEEDLPGETTFKFNTKEIGSLPTAAWWNLNEGWAYTPKRHKVKTSANVLGTMAKAFARDSAFFINVGPRQWGDIHPEEAQVLREIGEHLRGK
jgi:alpha-L-fucosidase